jgi:hypothetical protein
MLDNIREKYCQKIKKIKAPPLRLTTITITILALVPLPNYCVIDIQYYSLKYYLVLPFVAFRINCAISSGSDTADAWLALSKRVVALI